MISPKNSQVKGSGSLVLYNPYSYVYCRFCKNTYNIRTFKIHLKFCQNFLNYIRHSKNLLEYKKKQIIQNKDQNKISLKRLLIKQAPVNRQTISFENYVKNKKVIIVGPSITVEDSNLGSFVDNFDVIVRLNKSLPIPSYMYKNIGSRTDILYNSLNTSDYPGENKFEPNFLLRNNVKYLRCPYPPINPFRKDILSFNRINRNRINFSHINTNFYKRMQFNLKTRPYTGTCAIADLLHCGVKELFVMGIDFYTYRYAVNYRNISPIRLNYLRKNHIHDREPQINLIRRFYLLSNNLVCDNILTDILIEKYNNFIKFLKNQISFYQIFLNQGRGELNLSSFVEDLENTSVLIKKNIILNNNIHVSIILKNSNNIYCLNCFNNENSYIKTKIKSEGNIEGEDTIILKTYYDNIDSDFFYINPNFITLIKELKNKFLSKKMGMSSELFLLCIFCSFFKNIRLENIDLNSDWKNTNSSQMQDFIERRMFFRYLQKRIIK